MRITEDELSLLPAHVRAQVARQTGIVHEVDRRTKAAKARGVAQAARATGEQGSKAADQAALFLGVLARGGAVSALHETPGLWQTPFGLLWRNHIFTSEAEWQLDWAYPTNIAGDPVLVAIEVDGGQWKPGGGRHGSDGDRDKLNAAAGLGWRVLRFSPRQLRKEQLECFERVRRAMEWGR